MKKSNNKSKVVAAFAMLLVSVVALSSASYAWFTMSKQVQVTGLELTATAPDNILIASNADAYTTITPYTSVQTLSVGTSDVLRGGTNVNVLTQDLLKPCSSTDGLNLFQTPDITDSGADKGDDATYAVAAVSTADADKADELFYIDVPLYILTTGSKDVKVELDEGLSTIAAKDTGEIYKAARFAVLNNDSSANVGGTYEATASMFGEAVESVDEGVATYETLHSAQVLGTATTLTSTQIQLYGTDSAQTKNVDSKYIYTKIVVRVWIEGQNANCITKNADQRFKVDLTFKAV